jgi:hypothetical protein
MRSASWIAIGLWMEKESIKRNLQEVRRLLMAWADLFCYKRCIFKSIAPE